MLRNGNSYSSSTSYFINYVYLQLFQVLVDKGKDVKCLSFHCGVSIIGKLKPSTHPKQEIELHAEQIKASI